MKLHVPAVRKCLKSFDFVTLFREHLGWDNYQATLEVALDGETFRLSALAEKRGFVAWHCSSIPDRATRLKIDRKLTKSSREHFVVYADQPEGRQIWQWVRREPGKPLASRDHRFDVTQSGDALIQRLEQIAFSLDEEEKITILDVAGGAKAAFDVDKVTKKFFDRFKAEHAGFVKLIRGISAQAGLDWYASLMLNRLMFVYFIQKKGFLDGDVDYLRNRLERIQQARGKGKFQSFYRYFLLRLFHDALGRSPDERHLDPALEKLLGKVPYLNGGFFEVHQLEESNPDIDIPDEAFERLFDFFDQYAWHLDERPLRADNEINPDVVGYIFEKYVNQKQMGAYYTKEDITEYISKNTLIPFLFDAARRECAVAFAPDSALWRLLREDSDRYIYSAVRHGVVDAMGDVLPLPAEIEAGVTDVSKRAGWNKPAGDGYALPTETWREHVARRQRCLELREKLRRGDVHQINDLVTLNLDIWQFARDAIVNAEGPELLRAFWRAIEKVTVLDPTCGSGAFLFAALRILESLYSDCLARMEDFVQDSERPLFKTVEDVVRALIEAGESSSLEFKASARWDLKEDKHNPALEEVVVKTVAGFLNGQGGTLLIGVDDSGGVLGLAKDYERTKGQTPGRDSFELWLTKRLMSDLGQGAKESFHVDFASLEGQEVCRVVVVPSPKPILVKKGESEILYVREGNATNRYDKPSEILAYTSQHWGSGQPIPSKVATIEPVPMGMQQSEKVKPRYKDFRSVADQLSKHPNERYFILKSIIINNLFGVDIMEEATEICKLRLFLKLVAQVETAEQIEPLPDIDFNIRAGNTLVGFVSLDAVRKSQENTLDFGDDQVARIEEDAEMVERAFRQFRAQQTTHGGVVTAKDKKELRRRLVKLDAELDRYLADEYAVKVDKPKDFGAWKDSHQPFHWFIEFYGIMSAGGFDVVIGNPPYVEYSKVVEKYRVPRLAELGNLHAMVTARCLELVNTRAGLSMIVPVSLPSTDRFAGLRELLSKDSLVWTCHFDFRPSKLFEGANQRLTIFVRLPGDGSTIFSTRYNRWYAEARRVLFPCLCFEQWLLDEGSGRLVWPKLAGAECIEVLSKVARADSAIAILLTPSGSQHLYYKSTGMLYYTTFTREAPSCLINGRRTPSSRETSLRLSSQATRNALHAILNSSLFYFTYQALSNCRDLNPSDIGTFRVPRAALTDTALLTLSDALHRSQQTNSHFITRQQKLTGEVRLQSFRPGMSKAIIDQIDHALAPHYGLTDDEVDLVVNHDLKYRESTSDEGNEGEA